MPTSPDTTLASTAAPAPRVRMPRAQREEQILRIAEEVFAERGFQATTMEDIAERVGVTKPLIYEYFGSKEGLLSACITSARSQLRVATEAAWQEVGPDAPLEVIFRAGVGAFFDLHRRARHRIRPHPAGGRGRLAGQPAHREHPRAAVGRDDGHVPQGTGPRSRARPAARGLRRGDHRRVRAGRRVAHPSPRGDRPRTPPRSSCRACGAGCPPCVPQRLSTVSVRDRTGRSRRGCRARR